MLLDVLSDSRFTARIVEDGDASALKADLLLMVGDCQAFQEYPALLSRHNAARPITILWMLDTLPPLSFTQKAANISSRLAFYDKSRSFLRSNLKPVLNVVPIEIRRKMGLAACSALLAGLDRELETTSQEELRDLDVNSRYEILGRYQWMKANCAIGWLDHLVVSTSSKADLLAQMQIPSIIVPFGYHPKTGRNLQLKRDIDVLFVGELAYGRRMPIVENLRDRLAEQGIELVIESGNCYGEERNRLLSRSKISVNIPRFSWDVPGIRFIISMACGSLVISEEAGDATPFIPGEHFIQAPADRLPEVIAHYLRHDEEREMIAANANRFITEDLTLAKAVESILDLQQPDVACGME